LLRVSREECEREREERNLVLLFPNQAKEKKKYLTQLPDVNLDHGKSFAQRKSLDLRRLSNKKGNSD